MAQQPTDEEARANAEKWANKLMKRVYGDVVAPEAEKAGITGQVAGLMAGVQTNSEPLLADAIDNSFNAARGEGKGKIPLKLLNQYHLKGDIARATEEQLQGHAYEGLKHEAAVKPWGVFVVGVALIDIVMLWGYFGGAFPVDGYVLAFFLILLAVFVAFAIRTYRDAEMSMTMVSFVLCLGLVSAKTGGEWLERYKKAIGVVE